MRSSGVRTAYVSTIVGIVLVLFVMGVLSWFALGINKLTISKKESFEIDLFFDKSINDIELGLIEIEIEKKPFTASASYRSSEEAWDVIKEDIGGDSVMQVLDNENPLNQSIILTLKSEYFSLDSMKVIESQLKSDYGESLLEISYDQNIFAQYNSNIRKMAWFVLLIALMLMFVAIGMINNTIRLALFSKRFLIKTMQLVGATPGFIRRPFLLSAAGQGLISGLIAGTMVLGLISLLERYNSHFLQMTDMTIFLMVLGGLMIFGVLLTVTSTWFALRKYLRLKLDHLY